MKKISCLAGLFVLGLLAGCGTSADTCNISAAVVPANATADHAAPAPGNQVQFSITSTVTGNCSARPDLIGSWSTSDPLHTSISNQVGTQGLATCLAATPGPVTISTSGTVRGHGINSGTLTCN